MPAAGGDALALQIALVSLAVLWRRVPEPVLICAVGLIGMVLADARSHGMKAAIV